MANKEFSSLHKLIKQVFKDYTAWETTSKPWFRGEPNNINTPLLPKIFRLENGRKHDELKLLQHFRMKAPSFGLLQIPPRENTDQWLFLAQHVGLPTRLLDWTGGLLIALHFALNNHEKGAVVWMLDPDELNRKTASSIKNDDYGLTWFSQRNRSLIGNDLYRIRDIVKSQGNYELVNEICDNLASMNIEKAWTKKSQATPYPFAIYPTNIHPRMSSQISRFTIHGQFENPMQEMDLGERILKKYVISDCAITSMIRDLRILGISHSSLFPDLDGLSCELSEIY